MRQYILMFIAIFISIFLMCCAGQKNNTVDDEKKQKKATNMEQAEESVPSTEVIEKCKLFEPPWGDQNWSEWWQQNPEKGEQWFAEYPMAMKTADLSVIPQCTHLTNMLVGFAPLKDLTYFTGLTNLKKLDIRFAKEVKDLSPLANMKDLEMLNIWGTSVSDLSPLVGLDKLTFINARMTKITDLTPVPGIKNLAAIDLLRTEVNNIAPLSKAEKMTDILLCTTKVEDLSPLYEVAERIKYLDLCNAPFSDFKDLTKFKNLEILKLWGLPLGKIDFVQDMTKLEELDLSGAEFDSLKPLYGLKNLKKVTLLNTKYKEEELDKLKESNPALEFVLALD